MLRQSKKHANGAISDGNGLGPLPGYYDQIAGLLRTGVMYEKSYQYKLKAIQSFLVTVFAILRTHEVLSQTNLRRFKIEERY